MRGSLFVGGPKSGEWIVVDPTRDRVEVAMPTFPQELYKIPKDPTLQPSRIAYSTCQYRRSELRLTYDFGSLAVSVFIVESLTRSSRLAFRHAVETLYKSWHGKLQHSLLPLPNLLPPKPPKIRFFRLDKWFLRVACFVLKQFRKKVQR